MIFTTKFIFVTRKYKKRTFLLTFVQQTKVLKEISRTIDRETPLCPKQTTYRHIQINSSTILHSKRIRFCETAIRACIAQSIFYCFVGSQGGTETTNTRRFGKL